MHIEKATSEKGGKGFNETFDPEAAYARAKKQHDWATQALSDPEQVVGPSGESRVKELERERDRALEELKNARTALGLVEQRKTRH